MLLKFCPFPVLPLVRGSLVFSVGCQAELDSIHVFVSLAWKAIFGRRLIGDGGVVDSTFPHLSSTLPASRMNALRIADLRTAGRSAATMAMRVTFYLILPAGRRCNPSQSRQDVEFFSQLLDLASVEAPLRTAVPSCRYAVQLPKRRTTDCVTLSFR